MCARRRASADIAQPSADQSGSARRHGRALYSRPRQARRAKAPVGCALQHWRVHRPRLHRPPGRVQAQRRPDRSAGVALHLVAGHHGRALRSPRPALWRRHRAPPRRRGRQAQGGLSALLVVQVAGVCGRRPGLAAQVGLVRRGVRRGSRSEAPRLPSGGSWRQTRGGARAARPAARDDRDCLPPGRADGLHAPVRLLQHDVAAARDQGGRECARLHPRAAGRCGQRDQPDE